MAVCPDCGADYDVCQLHICGSKFPLPEPLTPADVQVGDWVRWGGNIEQHIDEVVHVSGDDIHIGNANCEVISRSWIREVRRG